MTRKQRKFVAALRDGVSFEEAAAIAGYTRAYAQRLMNEPEMIRAIEEPERKRPAEPVIPDEEEASPEKILESMIKDDLLDERVRISAVRAFHGIVRDRKPKGPPPPVIIDDIPCRICERRSERNAQPEGVQPAGEYEGPVSEPAWVDDA